MQLSEDQKKIARLQGEVLAISSALQALIGSLSMEQRSAFAKWNAELSESGKASMLGMTMPEEALQSYDDLTAAIHQQLV